jgi:hypothetical protein
LLGQARAQIRPQRAAPLVAEMTATLTHGQPLVLRTQRPAPAPTEPFLRISPAS